MKEEFYKIIDYCDDIKADERSKKVAVDMWKKSCERYIISEISKIDKCRWHGIYGLITSYEAANLTRKEFFDYMNEVVSKYI